MRVLYYNYAVLTISCITVGGIGQLKLFVVSRRSNRFGKRRHSNISTYSSHVDKWCQKLRHQQKQVY